MLADFKISKSFFETGANRGHLFRIPFPQMARGAHIKWERDMEFEGISQLATGIGDRWVRDALGNFGAYAITTGLFVILIWGIRPAKLMARKIQARSATLADVRREILYSIQTVMVFATIGLLGYTLVTNGLTQLYFDIGDYGWLWLALSLPIMLVMHDTWFYWTHRMMHHPKLFRTFHWTHHKSRTPTPFTAFSFDAPEAASHALFTTVYMVLFPMHPLIGISFTVVMIIRNVMGHAGHELHPKGWVDNKWLSWINTTTHHDLHHTRGTTNYGLYFTWWDKLMGTEHPEYKETFRAITANGAEAAPARPSLARRLQPMAAALVFAAFGLLLANRALANDLTDQAHGLWISPDETLVIDIQPCPEDSTTTCGQIVWHHEGTLEDGSPRLDEKNPSPALRTRPVVGLMIGTGFTQKAGEDVARGQIYSPDDGGTYRAKIAMAEGGDQLNLTGCWFIFCRTEQLNRLQAPLMADAAPQNLEAN